MPSSVNASHLGELPYDSPIRTVYDETYRGVWHSELCIASTANLPHLIGHLENHKTSTDGSFSICIAGGSGIFISQALYDSIPEEHRPELYAPDAGRTVTMIFGGSMTIVGSTLLPFILSTHTNEKVRLVLRVYISPNLLMGMFIGQDGGKGYRLTSVWGDGPGPHFTFEFGNEACRFDGLSMR